MQNLYIVITDFNGFASTRSCLKSLDANRKHNYTILVVDHGTIGTTRIGLETEFPNVIRVVGSPELWWSGANNLGIRAALNRGADAIMLLNNDCCITPNSVAKLVELSAHNPDAIVAPLQLDLDTGKYTAISPFSCFLLGFTTISGPKELTFEMFERNLLPVKLIIGGRGVIVPSSLLEKTGLFDEKTFPHYGADHDFYLRARKKNITLYVATKVSVEVDTVNTSKAYNPGSLDFKEFLSSLASIRSHRNLRDISALFKAHYPIPCLYPLGVALYLMRYLLVYFLSRAFF